MPMMDAYIPEGALHPEAEQQLLADLTDLLLVHEGADPENAFARSIAWIFLNRPAEVFVAGVPARAPHYRMVCAVPEGQFDHERRQAIVAAVTERVLNAEEGAHPRDPSRVWVITSEIPDGTWGGGGRIVSLADIAGLALGDPERGRRHAEHRLGLRREVQQV